MDELQRVTLGRAPADLVVRNGRVLLPGSDAFRERDVLVSGSRIAGVVADGAKAIGEATRVLDAEGRFVVPGFVDSHAHLDIHQAFETVYHHALEGGTTSVVADTMHLGSVAGSEAVEAMLAATADLPVCVFPTVPPQPLADTFEPARADERETARLCDLLARDRVVGVGEIDWIHVVDADSPIEVLVERAHAEGLVVSAHGTGCSGDDLAALASVVDNDHEALTGDELVARAENGIHAIGRSGAIRDDVDAVAAAHARLHPTDLSIATDEVSLRALRRGEYMDAVVRRAVDAGVPPVAAIRMVTTAPARHFGLNCGSLSPGKRADVVVLSDLRTVEVDTVVSGGDVVVREGESLVGPTSHEYPPTLTRSVSGRIDEDDFRTTAPRSPVRAIDYRGGLISAEATVDPPVDDGDLVADAGRDIAKATLLDRHWRRDREPFVGLLTGFGFESGAIATTQTWEIPGVLVVGTDDRSMVRAARRVVELRGGWAVADGADVLADLPLPVGGHVSDRPAGETVDGYEAVEDAIGRLGSDVEDPIVGLQTLTFLGTLSLKLAKSGYADVRNREIVGLEP